MRAISSILMVTAVALLAGCGKSGHPAVPDNSYYPLIYPAPALGGQAGAPTPAVAKARALEDSNPKIPTRKTSQEFTAHGSYIDPSVAVPLLGATSTNAVTFGATRSLSVPGEFDNTDTDQGRTTPLGQTPDTGQILGTGQSSGMQ